MGVGSGLYMYDVVVKRSRSLSYLLMSSCILIVVCTPTLKTREWTTRESTSRHNETEVDIVGVDGSCARVPGSASLSIPFHCWVAAEKAFLYWVPIALHP